MSSTIPPHRNARGPLGKHAFVISSVRTQVNFLLVNEIEMPQIAAFRGIRYNLGKVGMLSDVIAPPYDVIDPLLLQTLYDRHPENIVRLILPRVLEGDSIDAPYLRAAGTLRDWLTDGILQVEGESSIYAYHQEFQWEGVSYVRQAFICRVKLEPFGQGEIFPHEETHPKAKEDRLRLTKACRANLSPVFGLYSDPTNRAQNAISRQIVGVAGVTAIDHLGVKHTLWPISDTSTVNEVVSALGGQPLFIADGHHRYETACNYRDYLEATHGALPPEHPAHSVMVACVSLDDPGLRVLLTHRLLRGVPRFGLEELSSRLANHFLCEPGPEGVEGAHQAWAAMQFDHDQEMLALYVEPENRWVFCQALPEAMARLQQLEPQHSDTWRGLGVSLLHRLVLDDLLGCEGHPKPTYVHSIDEVVDGLLGRGQRSEEESGEPYTMAALVQPATLDHVQELSLGGERMPAKSTYFYPKLLSGLVVNPLY